MAADEINDLIYMLRYRVGAGALKPFATVIHWQPSGCPHGMPLRRHEMPRCQEWEIISAT